MLTIDEALERLITAAREQVRPEVEACELPLALGRILAEDITSPVAVPPRDNSAMDGYAFDYETAKANGFVLPVRQRIPAGASPHALENNSAARIFTGAEMPELSDTVAMQEECSVSDGVVTLPGNIKPGANVRPEGQDVTVGQRILERGTVLRPQEMGLVASVGKAAVSVFKPLKVAIFSSGDELVEPGNELKPGQIYNSNRYTLAGLLRAWGMDVIDCGVCKDTPQAAEAMLKTASEQGDVVVSSGGVSVGEEDHIKAAVTSLGSIDFWKINIKPGKPVAFGELQGVPFVGLPGNPSSVFVTALLLLRPFLLAANGHANPLVTPVKITSGFARKCVKRQEYLRAKLEQGVLKPHPNQSSGMLSSACWADGLAVQKANSAIAEGQELEFFSFAQLLAP